MELQLKCTLRTNDLICLLGNLKQIARIIKLMLYAKELSVRLKKFEKFFRARRSYHNFTVLPYTVYTIGKIRPYSMKMTLNYILQLVITRHTYY